MENICTDPALLAALKQSTAREMTVEEIAAQRASWVRGIHIAIVGGPGAVSAPHIATGSVPKP